jgi:hypothetical protein
MPVRSRGRRRLVRPGATLVPFFERGCRVSKLRCAAGPRSVRSEWRCHASRYASSSGLTGLLGHGLPGRSIRYCGPLMWGPVLVPVVRVYPTRPVPFASAARPNYLGQTRQEYRATRSLALVRPPQMSKKSGEFVARTSRTVSTEGRPIRGINGIRDRAWGRSASSRNPDAHPDAHRIYWPPMFFRQMTAIDRFRGAPA